jgi:hypothetical protein
VRKPRPFRGVRCGSARSPAARRTEIRLTSDRSAYHTHSSPYAAHHRSRPRCLTPGRDLLVRPPILLQGLRPHPSSPATAGRSHRSTSGRAPPAAPVALLWRRRSASSRSRRTGRARYSRLLLELRMARSISATGFCVGCSSFRAGLSYCHRSPWSPSELLWPFLPVIRRQRHVSIDRGSAKKQSSGPSKPIWWMLVE